METIFLTLFTQCPVLGILIWFLAYQTKSHNEINREQMRMYAETLDKIVNRIELRIQNIENTLNKGEKP